MWEQAVFGANHKKFLQFFSSKFPFIQTPLSLWENFDFEGVGQQNLKVQTQKLHFFLFHIDYSTLSFHSGYPWFVSLLPGVDTKFSASIRSLLCFWLSFTKTSTHWKNLDFSPSSGKKANRKPSGHFIPWNSAFWTASVAVKKKGRLAETAHESFGSSSKGSKLAVHPQILVSSASIVKMGSFRVPSNNWICCSQNAWGL